MPVNFGVVAVLKTKSHSPTGGHMIHVAVDKDINPTGTVHAPLAGLGYCFCRHIPANGISIAEGSE